MVTQRGSFGADFEAHYLCLALTPLPLGCSQSAHPWLAPAPPTSPPPSSTFILLLSQMTPYTHALNKLW